MINEILETAIRENKNIQIVYTNFNGESSVRIISGVKYSNNYTLQGYHNDHIVGFCHKRNEERTFKISRIKSIKLVSDSVKNPSKTDVKAYTPPKPSAIASKTYNIPKPSTPPLTTKSNSGCYIATMVYGDYEHHQVKILRKFRDEILINYLLGRVFINFYYYSSPTAVKILKEKKFVNHILKIFLNKLIIKLKKRYGLDD